VRAAIKRLAVREKAVGPTKSGTGGKTPGQEQRGPSKTGIYVVEPGDTLWAVSRRYSMTVKELMHLNGIKDDLIHPGDRLKVTSPDQP
jgi:LysM repeat protein